MNFVRPQKRKRLRMDLRDLPQWRSQRQLKHVRSHCCMLADHPGHVCEGVIEAMHKRTETDAAKDVKPSDYWSCPGCSGAHREQHQIGEQPFEAKYGVSMGQWCEAMQKTSPLAKEIREHRLAHPVAYDRRASDRHPLGNAPNTNGSET